MPSEHRFRPCVVQPCRPPRRISRQPPKARRLQTSQQRHGQPSLSKRIGNDRVERVRLKNRHILVDPVEHSPNHGCGCFRIHRGADDDVEKRNASLWPGPVKFDIVRFCQFARSNIANYAHDFGQQAITIIHAEKELVAQAGSR